MAWISVSERMPEVAQDDGDILYCRVVYDDPWHLERNEAIRKERQGRPPERRVGYFDGGEWKDIGGYKFATYGGSVTHWYEPPELPAGVDTSEPPLPEALVIVRDADPGEDGGWIVDCDCEGPRSY